MGGELQLPAPCSWHWWRRQTCWGRSLAQQERGREEREKPELGAPSLSESRLKPVGLGKGTKQRVRAGSHGERDSEVFSQQFGMSRFTLKSRALAPMISESVSGELWFEARASFSAQQVDLEGPGWKPGILAAHPPGARGSKQGSPSLCPHWKLRFSRRQKL